MVLSLYTLLGLLGEGGYLHNIYSQLHLIPHWLIHCLGCDNHIVTNVVVNLAQPWKWIKSDGLDEVYCDMSCVEVIHCQYRFTISYSISFEMS